MNLNRILINESEKQRILGMHNALKKNPTTGLLKEALSEFPLCVRNAGKEVKNEYGGTINYIKVPNGGGKGKDYHWFSDGVLQLFDTSLNDWGAFPDGSTQLYYHCKCVNGKCTPKSYPIEENKRPDECDEKKACNTQGTTPGGQKDSNCKNKTPYNAFTDAGLNWKEESRKWIEAKCNGTTPCISGNASTNINLRNAFCDGTWGSKKEQDVQNPSLNPACSSKCAEQPKVVPPGTIVTQQIGYFYDSIQGKCVGVTGQNGPFGSIAECEACKCGSQGTIGDGGNKPGDGGNKPGDGGQKPGDGGNKLPDFIPPTIVKPIKALD